MVAERDIRGRFISTKGIDDVDKGYQGLVRRFLNWARRGPSVTIGIQGTEASEEREDGLTNAELAMIHEFGTADGNIVQRSFIRGTVEREKGPIFSLLRKETKAMAKDGDFFRHLGRVGEFVKSEMVKTIDQSIGLPKLEPATIAEKGSTQPLIDTGILKGSITWKVHRS